VSGLRGVDCEDTIDGDTIDGDTIDGTQSTHTIKDHQCVS